MTITSNNIEGTTKFYLKSDDVESDKISITVVDKTKKAEEEAARKAQEAKQREQEEAARKAEEERQAQIQAQNQVTQEMVYIPNSGSKYHSRAGCSNMINPSQVSLEEAQRRGYTPCKKCY